VEPEQSAIPARLRLTGRALNAMIAHAPWMWPLLRAPVRRFFDGLARDWDEGRADSVEHMQPLAEAVTRVSPEPERILDLGTGTGLAALFLAREFPRASVRGVDISEQMIAEAQRKVGLDPTGRVAFKVADAAHLPYGDDSFDLVAQLNMPPFFAETTRVLRPGGHVIIAASSGPGTPFYTPESVLTRGFRRHGVETVEAGPAGAGTWFIGRSTQG
jgi:ubiquinone/menaquinone biosynthesis C-methylase UbiE